MMLLATLYIYIGSFFIVPKLQIYTDYLFYLVFTDGFCGFASRKYCWRIFSQCAEIVEFFGYMVKNVFLMLDLIKKRKINKFGV